MNVFLDAHVFDEAGQGSKTYLKGMFTEAIQHRKDINFVLAVCNRDKGFDKNVIRLIKY